MAIELVGSVVTHTAYSSMSVPSGMQEGDVLFIYSGSGSNMPYLPTGFTEIDSYTGPYVYGMFARRVMGATPVTSISGFYDISAQSHIAFALRGIDLDNILDVSLPSPVYDTSGMPNSPSITTETSKAWVIAVATLDDDYLDATAPTNYTLLGTEYVHATYSHSTMAAYREKSPAGAENPGAFGGAGNDAWCAFTCAVRPIVEAGAGLEMGCNF